MHIPAFDPGSSRSKPASKKYRENKIKSHPALNIKKEPKSEVERSLSSSSYESSEDEKIVPRPISVKKEVNHRPQTMSKESDSESEDTSGSESGKMPQPKLCIKKGKPSSDEETSSVRENITRKKEFTSTQTRSGDSSSINSKKGISTQSVVKKHEKRTSREHLESDTSDSDSEKEIPKPNVRERKPSSDESDSETEQVKIPKPVIVQKKDYTSESSSESETPFSPKKEMPTMSKAKNNSVVPSPIVEKQSESDTESSDSENEMPQPKSMVKEAKPSSDEESDSETGHINLSKHIVQKKLSPKINGSNTSKNKIKSSAIPQVAIRKEQTLSPKDSDSSDNDVEVPRPKIKNEKNKSNQKVPKPMFTKNENSSSDDDSENELRAMKLALRQSPKKKMREYNEEEADYGTPKTRPSINVIQNVDVTPRYQPTHWEEKVTQTFPCVEKVNAEQNLLESISENISILRIPKNLDPSMLLNKKLKSNKETRLHINDQHFVVRPIPKEPDPTLVVAKSSKILNIDRIYILEKDVEIKKEPEIVAPHKFTVPFPDTLKPRHPLFGAEYKDKIKLSSYAEQKLDAANQNLIQEKKRKIKKDKKEKKRQKLTQSANQVIFDLLNQTSSNKVERSITVEKGIKADSTPSANKTKKLKVETETNSNSNNEILHDNNIDQHYVVEKHPSKKKKRKSLDASVDTTRESESITGVSETDQTHSKKKRNNVEASVDRTGEQLCVVEKNPSKKKKRKSLEASVDRTGDQLYVVDKNQENTNAHSDSTPTSMKNKKSKVVKTETNSNLFENRIQYVINKVNNSIDGHKKQKKYNNEILLDNIDQHVVEKNPNKKKKRKSLEANVDTTQESESIRSESETDQTHSKKKRKSLEASVDGTRDQLYLVHKNQESANAHSNATSTAMKNKKSKVITETNSTAEHKKQKKSNNEILHDTIDQLYVVKKNPSKEKKGTSLERNVDTIRESETIRSAAEIGKNLSRDSNQSHNYETTESSGGKKDKKKTKLFKSVANSTVMPGLLSSPGFSNDISAISYPTPAKQEKKKKKNKSDLISDILGSEKVNILKKKEHKKKKNKRHPTVENIEESIVSPKKKKKRKRDRTSEEDHTDTVFSKIKKEGQ